MRIGAKTERWLIEEPPLVNWRRIRIKWLAHLHYFNLAVLAGLEFLDNGLKV